MNVRIFKCSVCGQIVMVMEDTGVPMVCCGEEMEELIPCSVDASLEKHVPVISVAKCRVFVTVGSEPHPMTDAHCIRWILLQTKNGNQCMELQPGTEPEVCFRICEGDEVEAAYAYCNLHGLWKADYQP
ncbi:MAG: desulfoferrodoxin [Clostridia bacterium]|nr:desulfoferrodoxin [Clostridia bacterium]